MPPNKETKVFLAAGFGVFDDYPIFNKKEGYKSWLINQLKKYSANPYISYLNPDKEFNRNLQLKLDEQ